YGPGGRGNGATEDLAAMLVAMGIETGVDLEALVEVAWSAEETVGRPLEGRFKRAVRGAEPAR
ncbi:MAG: hydroxymethylglutaryl-CoA lyase, partial [Chloroflexi bacterium]|nr:hydroxymethylglutaryl-CoA lyase [Chloroflexota bacterium]